MNKVTDGSFHAAMTDRELAAWLLGDAQKVDGKPGMNNVASSIRQAAFRLAPELVPWLGVE